MGMSVGTVLQARKIVKCNMLGACPVNSKNRWEASMANTE